MSTEERVARLEAAFVKLVALAEHADERSDDFDARMGELVEAQKQTAANLSALSIIVSELGKSQRDTDARLDRMAESGRTTDARLDRLAALVERHIADGHGTNGNGHA